MFSKEGMLAILVSWIGGKSKEYTKGRRRTHNLLAYACNVLRLVYFVGPVFRPSTNGCVAKRVDEDCGYSRHMDHGIIRGAHDMHQYSFFRCGKNNSHHIFKSYV